MNRIRKKVGLAIMLISIGVFLMPQVLPDDYLGGYWEERECLVDYDYYYCDWFVVGKLDVVNETTYAQPEWANDCYHGHWYGECIFIPCEEVADMESLGGDILTYCLPPKDACIREWAGAYCPGDIFHGRMEIFVFIGIGLFVFGALVYNWSFKPEEDEQ